MSHTSGKWVAKDRAVLARCFTGEWRNIVDRVRGGTPVEADANARLIAAAPELLDVLKTLVETPEIHSDDMHKARAVIAEAEGA